jgi:hypothetical protein
LAAVDGIRSVDLTWQALKFSKSLKDPFVRVVRDGNTIAMLPGAAGDYRDTAVSGGTTYSYYLVSGGTYQGSEVTSPPSATVVATPTDALVGAGHTHSGPDTIGAWGGVADVQVRATRGRTSTSATSRIRP